MPGWRYCYELEFIDYLEESLARLGLDNFQQHLLSLLQLPLYNVSLNEKYVKKRYLHLLNRVNLLGL